LLFLLRLVFRVFLRPLVFGIPFYNPRFMAVHVLHGPGGRWRGWSMIGDWSQTGAERAAYQLSSVVIYLNLNATCMLRQTSNVSEKAPLVLPVEKHWELANCAYAFYVFFKKIYLPSYLSNRFHVSLSFCLSLLYFNSLSPTSFVRALFSTDLFVAD
jgi:phosphate starvation-inducible membrane PsiE